MKKTYITPSVEVIRVDSINMMATSLAVHGDKEVNTETEQLGREDNGSSAPGVWDSEW